ncbi:MAG: apolipoprotein N-acyltransferase [Holosporaceae bacterium]|jgi:apolipoprotein N-acyltransferase|nr:apolipoprotein N-acyltransferase [Holosporaceae bacterium]
MRNRVALCPGSQFLKSGILGAVTALAFAPFNLFPIFLATFAWLFLKIRETSRIAELMKQAFCFFCCLHIGCIYWLIYPLTLNLHKYWILIPFAITLIPAYLSLFLLVPVFCLRKCEQSAKTRLMSSQVTPMIFAAFFTLTMMFYGNFLPGFPWVLPGYIWNCHEIFLQTLSLYGIYGLSFVTLLISGFLGESLWNYMARRWESAKKSALLAVIIFLFLVLFGHFRLVNNPTKFTDKKVIVVQGNIQHEQKSASAFAYPNLRKHLNLSRHESKVDLIVWPEASVPYLYHENFTKLHVLLKSCLADGEHLLTGVVRKDQCTEDFYNSVVVINSSGENVAKYDKIHLLPFGEYIPFRIPLFHAIASEIDDFTFGQLSNLIEVGDLKIILAICYEIVFSRRLGTAATIDFSKADVIVNVTNDGWFGYTTEPFQHLQISRARAIETGLPVVRATNVGISAIFDPCGREISRVPMNQAGAFESPIPQKIIL